MQEAESDERRKITLFKSEERFKNVLVLGLHFEEDRTLFFFSTRKRKIALFKSEKRFKNVFVGFLLVF